MKRVVFFPKYTEKGPSSRYRIYQYLDFYKKEGIDCIVKPLLNDNYIYALYLNKHYSFLNIIYAYCKRTLALLLLKKDDVVYTESELFPYLPPFAEWYLKNIKKIKYILDYDDAIFHNYDLNKHKIIRLILSSKIPYIVSNANYVISGSPYLTNWLSRFNSNCIEIPTSIDIDKYRYALNLVKDGKDILNIGWIGSKTTSINLIPLFPVFRSLGEKIDYRLTLIGFDETLLNKFSNLNYKIIKWNKETEVEEIRKFDVGIMPLVENDFNKGKCGFKLIQYMACGKITVSTPLEANIKINRNNKNLFAITPEEWINAFLLLFNKKIDCLNIGFQNRLLIEQFYSIQSNYPKSINIFNSFFSNEVNSDM